VDPLEHWDASLQPLGLALGLAAPAVLANAALALPRYGEQPSGRQLAQLADCFEEVTSRFGGAGYKPDFEEPPRVAAVLGSARGLGWQARREALHLLQHFLLERWSAGQPAAGGGQPAAAAAAAGPAATEADAGGAEGAGQAAEQQQASARCAAAAALHAQRLQRLGGVRIGLPMLQVRRRCPCSPGCAHSVAPGC
jgi:hypothetical protein